MDRWTIVSPGVPRGPPTTVRGRRTLPPMDASPWLPLILVLLVAATILGLVVRRRRQVRASFAALLADEGLVATATPCGLTTDHLAGAFVATPRGDRRCGVRWGVDGPLPVRFAGADLEAWCTTFQWWSEDRRTAHTEHGATTRYVERSTMVAALRLPTEIPARIVLRAGTPLGRLGLTRGGQQLESSEFNRRFRVDSDDAALSVRLLDARLQHLLTERYAGRSVELGGDLLVLGGAPSHRDRRYLGVVGDVAATRADARRLLAAVPAQFWRACVLASGDDDVTDGPRDDDGRAVGSRDGGQEGR